MTVRDRLAELGLQLPAPVTAPPGVRLPFEFVRIHGDLAYVSGHGPFDGDRLLYTGRVGAEITVEQAYDAARATALSMFASSRRSATSTGSRAVGRRRPPFAVGDRIGRAAVRDAGRGRSRCRDYVN